MASIDAGGTTYSAYFFLRQKYGIDFWRKLAAQDPRLVPSAAPVMTDLARGETSIAIEPQESLVGEIANGTPVKIVHPPAVRRHTASAADHVDRTASARRAAVA